MIASCVRIAYVRAMLNNPDVLYTQGSAAVWSAVEINLGILCNCLAMLKPFVRRHMPWLRTLIGARSVGGGSGRDHVRAGHHASGKKKTTLHHRDRRESDGLYELYSYGRDIGFREDAVGTVDAKVEAGRPSDSVVSGSVEFGLDDLARPKGILVTTTVAMERSSEGDISTDYILARGIGGDFRAISTESKIGERA